MCSSKLEGSTLALSMRQQLIYLCSWHFIVKKKHFCFLFSNWKYSWLGFSFLGSKITGMGHTKKHTV